MTWSISIRGGAAEGQRLHRDDKSRRFYVDGGSFLQRKGNVAEQASITDDPESYPGRRRVDVDLMPAAAAPASEGFCFRRNVA
jgi:hypothetical protein